MRHAAFRLPGNQCAASQSRVPFGFSLLFSDASNLRKTEREIRRLLKGGAA